MSSPRPDFDQRIYPPQRIVAVVETLAEENIAAEQALAGSGLEPRDLQNVALRISYRQVIAVFRNALQLSRNPALALKAGERMHVTAYGMYGYALQSSLTHRDAIQFGLKYGVVIGGVVRNAFACENGVASFPTRVVISQDPLSDLYRFALEFGLTAHATILRDIYGPQFELSGVDICYPAPAHADAYISTFRCPVRFGQPINQLQFEAAIMDWPAVLADRITHAMAHQVCEQLLGELDQAESCVSQVRHALLRSPSRFPNLEAMATTLSVSPRQLRRRLDAEQASYRDIVAGVRMGLAVKYLRETRLTHEEIASRLGYSDGANFRRAFIKWAGRSPSSFKIAGCEASP